MLNTKRTYPILLICSLLFGGFTSCRNNRLDNSSLNLQDSNAIYIHKFKNEFACTEKFCKDSKLPFTRFRIEYPDNVNVEFAQKDSFNYSYVDFTVLENNHVVEFLSFGVSIIDNYDVHKAFIKNIVIDVVNRYREDYVDLDSIEFRDFKLSSEPSPCYLVSYTDLGKKDPRSKGKYFSLATILMPENRKYKAGIFLTWSVSDSKKIRNMDDFKKVGLTSQILETFSFIP